MILQLQLKRFSQSEAEKSDQSYSSSHFKREKTWVSTNLYFEFNRFEITAPIFRAINLKMLCVSLFTMLG